MITLLFHALIKQSIITKNYPIPTVFLAKLRNNPTLVLKLIPLHYCIIISSATHIT